jgi:hypothetical protein
MITDLDQLYQGFQTLVSTASGVDQSRVILADQGRPAPASDLYATYKPVPVRAYGFPRTNLKEIDAVQDFNESLLGADWQDLEATTVSQLEIMLSCNFLNEGAREAAWQMHNANHRLPVTEVLYTNSIGWQYASEIRDLTGVTQASVQPRYQLDVYLFVETKITDDILSAAGFSVNIEDEKGNTLANWRSI